MKCPYCQQSIKGLATFRFDLSHKQRQLFDHILASGIEGANNDTIMSELDIISQTTLRTRVHGINKRIAPLEITARGGSYRIERTEVMIKETRTENGKN